MTQTPSNTRRKRDRAGEKIARGLCLKVNVGYITNAYGGLALSSKKTTREASDLHEPPMIIRKENNGLSVGSVHRYWNTVTHTPAEERSREYSGLGDGEKARQEAHETSWRDPKVIAAAVAAGITTGAIGYLTGRQANAGSYKRESD